MLRIHQLFFLNVLGLFLTALATASLISFFTLKSMVIQQSEEQLIQAIKLLEPLLTSSDDLNRLASTAAGKTFFRVTLVDEEGAVIAESDAERTSMENHLGRVEIMDAMRQPYGIATRYSTTLNSDFLYVAHKIVTSDRTFYIRLAMSLDGVMKHFYSLWLKLLMSFIVLMGIALIISYKISQKARYDIQQITQFLDQVSAKNYRAPLKPEFFREFLQISLSLKNLVKKLHNRDKQKRKHTAKLRLINKQQNDILSAISHEFKNPIAAVMGYAETLKDDPKIDLKIRDKFLEKILSNTRKITLMLDRLALSVKLENNDLSIKPTTFDLAEVCGDTISVLQGKYPNRKIHFNEFHKQIYADKTMIDMVITNLIDNALKYSEDEVTLTLDNESLRVTDRGIGIAATELENITNKFYRVQKNRWDNSMGLGLSIVTYILRLHNTELTITSKYGQGSTFGFSLLHLHEPPKKTKV